MKRRIEDLAYYIKKTGSVYRKAYGLALMETGQLAEKHAKLNARKNFKGRYGYTLSGRLLNSIFNSFKFSGSEPVAYVGTRGIAYGRINEEGGTIYPVKAKYLWQRLSGKGSEYKRMTPSDFYRLAKTSGRFGYVTSKSGKRVAGVFEQGRAKTGKPSFKALFLLRDETRIKARPFLMPAAMTAGKAFPSRMNKRFNELTRMGV